MKTSSISCNFQHETHLSCVAVWLGDWLSSYTHLNSERTESFNILNFYVVIVLVITKLCWCSEPDFSSKSRLCQELYQVRNLRSALRLKVNPFFIKDHLLPGGCRLQFRLNAWSWLRKLCHKCAIMQWFMLCLQLSCQSCCLLAPR